MSTKSVEPVAGDLVLLRRKPLRSINARTRPDLFRSSDVDSVVRCTIEDSSIALYMDRGPTILTPGLEPQTKSITFHSIVWNMIQCWVADHDCNMEVISRD